MPQDFCSYFYRRDPLTGKMQYTVVRPQTTLEWAFFSVTAVQAIVIILIQVLVQPVFIDSVKIALTATCESVILVAYLHWVNPVAYQVPVSYTVPMCFAISALGCIFQAFLTLDSFRIKNNIQIFAQCVCNVCLSIALIMQYGQTKNAVDCILVNHDMYGTPFAKNDIPFWQDGASALVVCIILSWICSVSMCALAYWLHIEFAWVLYEHVSPNVKARSRYMVYQGS